MKILLIGIGSVDVCSCISIFASYLMVHCSYDYPPIYTDLQIGNEKRTLLLLKALKTKAKMLRKYTFILLRTEVYVITFIIHCKIEIS